MIDELVGNAYQHTTAVHELRVTRAAEHLLVEVHDADPDVTPVRAGGPGSGRFGLRLVDQLTVDWGARTDSVGKVVWALVPFRIFPAAP
ncbi:hypothetical protein Amsp01_105040 [Amycolatopsis sp. NBRC 101858]|nr:hypothetical protein Amsp01_105040 [Amycolatopsis sp. NBRC 101858]